MKGEKYWHGFHICGRKRATRVNRTNTNDNNVQSNDRVLYRCYLLALLPCVSRRNVFIFLRDQCIPQLLSSSPQTLSICATRILRKISKPNSVNSLNTHVTLLPCANTHVTVTGLKNVRLHNEYPVCCVSSPTFDGLLSFSLLP